MCWKCNTLDDLSNKVCVQNKTKDLNLHVFNMITAINELRTLKKHVNVSLMVENVTSIKSEITISICVSLKIKKKKKKKKMFMQKIFFWNT